MTEEPDHYGRVTARHYDAAYALRRDPSGDGAFYLELARASGGPVLELGCGTGRILLPIAEAGIPCTGLDLSPEMLQTLADKSPPDRMRLIEGRMQDFDLGDDRFALITAPFRVFQHLYTVEDQLACLGSVRRHLVPGGAFAFDCFKPRLDRLSPTTEPEAEDARWRDGEDEIVRSASVTRDHTTQMMSVTMHYDRLRGGERVERETMTFPMRYFFRYELEHLLQRAGFADLTLYGDFDRSAYGEDAMEMIWVARV